MYPFTSLRCCLLDCSLPSTFPQFPLSSLHHSSLLPPITPTPPFSRFLKTFTPHPCLKRPGLYQVHLIRLHCRGWTRLPAAGVQIGTMGRSAPPRPSDSRSKLANKTKQNTRERPKCPSATTSDFESKCIFPVCSAHTVTLSAKVRLIWITFASNVRILLSCYGHLACKLFVSPVESSSTGKHHIYLASCGIL